jgi:hypothetical protein
MLKSDLLQLIANGENSGIDFKRDDLRPEQLAKEIVAMANLKGGSVLLGVEDDGSISGIQRTDLELWVMDTVFSRGVHPMILPYYEEVMLDDGKRVAVGHAHRRYGQAVRRAPQRARGCLCARGQHWRSADCSNGWWTGCNPSSLGKASNGETGCAERPALDIRRRP